MAEFDPYHEWLGIPRHKQPITHYRLLGLSDGEPNPKVIENAADRQMAFLRQYTLGKRGKIASQLLNEVAQARVVLLDSEKKTEYDRQFRREEPRIASRPPDPIQLTTEYKPGEMEVTPPPVAPGYLSTENEPGEMVIEPPPPVPGYVATTDRLDELAVGNAPPAILPPISMPAENLVIDSVSATEDVGGTNEGMKRTLRWFALAAGVLVVLSIAVFIVVSGVLSPAVQLTEITNGIGMKLKQVPAGEFMMGSPESEDGRDKDETQRRVRITQPFCLGVTEVTQAQWKSVMGTEPWSGTTLIKEGPNYPATQISWEDAVEFCKRLSALEDRTYRLPTEAQWEYACRAGTTTVYSFGDKASNLGTHAWYRDNAYDIEEKYAHEVSLGRPNAWGFYDMHGNVWEWCQDRYGSYPSSQSTDPSGPTTGSSRVARGGSWYSYQGNCRSAYRGSDLPDYHYGALGFRVSCNMEE